MWQPENSIKSHMVSYCSVIKCIFVSGLIYKVCDMNSNLILRSSSFVNNMFRLCREWEKQYIQFGQDSPTDQRPSATYIYLEILDKHKYFFVFFPGHFIYLTFLYPFHTTVSPTVCEISLSLYHRLMYVRNLASQC